jgi:hypothetical protein
MKRKHGLADSPFFPTLPMERVKETPIFPEVITPVSPIEEASPDTPESSRYHGIVVSRYQDTNIESLRKAVKEFGKEAATHRFTLAEKRAIASILHTLQMQGIRTTENEITRIAVNFVIDEFNLHGKDSLLALVLQALNK